MAALDQLKGVTANVSGYWKKQTPKTKKLVLIGAGLIVAVAVILTVTLNMKKSGFEVLFPGSTAAEQMQVYALLQEKGATAEMNKNGEVIVPTEQLNKLTFDLQMEGLPKTSKPYGIYLDNVGPTTTESEKRELNRFELQDRLQDTMRQIDGIKDAMVTINLPNQSERVWDNKTSEATAAVLLTLDVSGELEPVKVATIKKLIAATLPNGKPTNVIVTDASTSVELDDATSNSTFNVKRLEFEKKWQKDLEDNIKRLLAPKFGADGIVAVAKVVPNYDKMKTETKEILPADGESNKDNESESYTANGGLPAQGIAGEDGNTDTPADIPGYAAQDGATTDNITNYDRETNYANGYILTQLERQEAPLSQATVAVMVNVANLTNELRTEITDLVSKAVNITPEFISVATMYTGTPTDPTGGNPDGDVPFYKNNTILAMIGGGMLLLFMLIIMIPILASRKRKRKAEKAEMLLAEEQAAAIDAAQKAQAEIDRHKSKLRNEAEAQKIQEGSMTEEIRSFAKENPEMAAVLIRSLLKEDG